MTFRLIGQLSVKFIPLFKKSSDPSIVNITSLGAHFLNRAVCEFSYAQSKAAGESQSGLDCMASKLIRDRGTLDQAHVGGSHAIWYPGQCHLPRSAHLLHLHPVLAD